METWTITLRLVVGSRDFSKRRIALDMAVSAALEQASQTLLDCAFVVEEQGAEIVNEGIAAGLAEAKRQSRPDDVT